MKKYAVLLLAAFWALSTPLAAQTVLGIHAGANVADLGGDDVSNTESHTGLTVGASVLFSLGESLGLYLGGDYSEKGAEISDPEIQGKFHLDYLEFPVLLRYGFPSSGSLGFHLFGGGAVGVELSCEIEGSDGSISVTLDCDEAEVDTKNLDFGLVGGAGLTFGLTERMDLALDILYNVGLTSIDDSSDDADVKNRVLTIRAGVAIPIG